MIKELPDCPGLWAHRSGAVHRVFESDGELVYFSITQLKTVPVSSLFPGDWIEISTMICGLFDNENKVQFLAEYESNCGKFEVGLYEKGFKG